MIVAETALERRASRASTDRARRRDRVPAHSLDDRWSAADALASYTSTDGASREVLMLAGANGSTLVVDRDSSSGRDVRLVAHLTADEPRSNASIVCEAYVNRASTETIRCRRLAPADLAADACGEPSPEEECVPAESPELKLRDRLGGRFCLEAVAGEMSIPELRWRVQEPASPAVAARTVSVRDVVAALEAYEPVCALTRGAIAGGGPRDDVSIAVLRLELRRVLCSPIVLNRKLRETVLALSVERDVSMSEIAIRCGRIKRDRAGNISGETSWLARRIGILPEGGRAAPTPWIHTDVLALIARCGLGVSPREVEPD